MKILSVSDKDGSAIDRLSLMNVRLLPHLQIVNIAIHPKRPEPERVNLFRQLMRDADVIDFQYWKTAVTLRELCPELEGKKMVLTHHNEHNVVGDWPWMKYAWTAHVVKNGWQRQELIKKGIEPTLIRHAADIESLPFIPKLTDEKVVGYVGQIKKVKGVRELKKACDELGYRLLVCGKPSEAEYWQELDKANLLYMHDIGDEKMAEEVFHRMRVYCANSDDGTESGTLPILEAMAAGIPVVTRSIGLVRDCGADGKNMIVRKGGMTDIEDLKTALKTVMESEDVANELRENAWRTVRQYHPDVQAREYEKLWKRIAYPAETPVSVVIPTCDRPGTLVETLAALNEQHYKNFEVIIADDGQDKKTRDVALEARRMYPFPVRYIETGRCASDIHHEAHVITKDYGLARARNLAVIEATGEILVFADDRFKLHPQAIGNMVKKLKSFTGKKVWIWGVKGGVTKSFVENFSATWRRAFIDGGMFNERIDRYGGMTQEISGRFGAQGFRFEFCPEATAEVLLSTHSKSKHRNDIVRSKIQLYKMGLQ